MKCGWIKTRACLVVVGLLAGHRASADAAVFMAGNLIVVREGNGTDDPTASTAAAPVSIREYTPAGLLVQSIDLPSSGAGAFTVVGNNQSDGGVQFSADGRYLVFAGYRANVLTGVNSATPRMIGRIDNDASRAVVQTVQAAAMNTAARGAASLDGSAFWVSTSNGGPRFLTYGQTVGTGNTLTAAISTRQVSIFGGDLYAAIDSGDGTGGILHYNGTPLATAPSTKIIDGPSGGFFMADLSGAVPGVDTLWAVDVLASEIEKYSLVGGTWVANGAIPSGGAVQLAGAVSGTDVTLYGSQLGKISTITDTAGYNAPNDGTVIDIPGFAAGTNYAFKGITTVTPEPVVALFCLASIFLMRRRG